MNLEDRVAMNRILVATAMSHVTHSLHVFTGQAVGMFFSTGTPISFPFPHLPSLEEPYYQLSQSTNLRSSDFKQKITSIIVTSEHILHDQTILQNWLGKGLMDKDRSDKKSCSNSSWGQLILMHKDTHIINKQTSTAYFLSCHSLYNNQAKTKSEMKYLKKKTRPKHFKVLSSDIENQSKRF